MSLHKRQVLVVLALVTATPVLQGAGCRTHYSARLRGQLVTDPQVAADSAGKEVNVIYRNRDETTLLCEEDWAPCLSAEGWHPLHPCDATPEGEGKSPNPKLGADGASLSFDACTQMIGVDYHADIAAFIDTNGDAKPSKGEVYGVYAGSPLTRDAEEKALPLEITLDKTMP